VVAFYLLSDFPVSLLMFNTSVVALVPFKSHCYLKKIISQPTPLPWYRSSKSTDLFSKPWYRVLYIVYINVNKYWHRIYNILYILCESQDKMSLYHFHYRH